MELPKEDKQYLLTLSTVSVADFVPTKLWFSETKSNYKIWKEQMLCLLESQGLVDFISKPQPTPKLTVDNPLTNNQENVVWKRTDWLIKDWILGSINDNIASTLLHKQSTTSRDVWLELKSMVLRQVAPVVHPLDKQADLEQKDFNSYLPLYTAIIDEKWDEAIQMIKADDDHGSLERALARSITITTALQVAVGTGKGIEKLVELVDDKELENLTDNYGTTVLGTAATMGNKEAVVNIVERAPQLLYIPNSFGNFPAHIAAQFSHKDTLEYLLEQTDKYCVSKFNYLTNPYGDNEDGLRLLTDIIDAEFIGTPVHQETNWGSQSTK